MTTHDCIIYYAIVHIYQVKYIRFLTEKARKEVYMALSEAGASVIGSGMGLIGSLFSGLGAKRKQKHAKEMMDYQNKLELERMEQQFGYQQQAAAQEQQYALDMYNHQFNTESAYNKEMLEGQRKYDSPVEEMKRLKEAGVNPALYYANGGGSGGSGIGAMGISASGSSASVGAPTGIQPMAVQVGLQAQQQEAAIELTRAQAAKTKAETVAETGIGMAQRILDALGKAKENKKTDVDIKKVEKEVENIDATIQVAKENANVLKENKELLAYQNKINQLKQKIKVQMETEGYTGDGENKSSWSKEYGFEDIIIQQETKKLLTDFMKMDKEYSEALKDRDVAVRLYNDIDKVIQGKLDELSITDKNLKLLETRLEREDYELKNDKALGDILEDLGGDSKYSKLLMGVINWFMRK